MRLAWILVALVSCGKGDQGQAPTPGSATAPGSAVGPGSAAAGSGASPVPGAGKDFVALLTAQTRPTLVGPFAALTMAPDLTIGKVREVAPELVLEANVMKALDWFEYKGDDYPGVSLRTERFGQIDSMPDTWVVGRLRAVFTDGTLKDKLTKAWGPPRTYGARSHWFDPAAKLRCVLQPSDGRDTPTGTFVFDCDGYTPIEELIGTGKPLFGFEEGKPLIGMTPTAVKQRWGRRVFDEGSRIMLWPTELAERATSVQIGDMEAPDKVTWFRVRLSADQKTLEKLLEAKFGKPRADEELGSIYRAKPRVLLRGSEIIVGIDPDD